MKKNFVFSIIVAIVILSILFSFSVVAMANPTYIYGQQYNDNVSMGIEQSKELPKHTFSERNIGANNINITSPNASEEYYLRLRVREWGSYKLFGNPVRCSTAGLGGYYFWQNSNYSYEENSNNEVHARLQVDRIYESYEELGGYLISTSRTWIG